MTMICLISILFPFLYVVISKSVWIMLTWFASQELLKWVQNCKHLPVPVFYYMAWKKHVCVSLCPRPTGRNRPSVYMLASGINKHPGFSRCVQTEQRPIKYACECTQDALRILPRLPLEVVTDSLKTKCTEMESNVSLKGESATFSGTIFLLCFIIIIFTTKYSNILFFKMSCNLYFSSDIFSAWKASGSKNCWGTVEIYKWLLSQVLV